MSLTRSLITSPIWSTHKRSCNSQGLRSSWLPVPLRESRQMLTTWEIKVMGKNRTWTFWTSYCASTPLALPAVSAQTSRLRLLSSQQLVMAVTAKLIMTQWSVISRLRWKCPTHWAARERVTVCSQLASYSNSHLKRYPTSINPEPKTTIWRTRTYKFSKANLTTEFSTETVSCNLLSFYILNELYSVWWNQGEVFVSDLSFYA